MQQFKCDGFQQQNNLPAHIACIPDFMNRFEGKRIVVREGRRPLNYYILLAGSAIVIKEDESGRTNPVLFMRRGDVFGVRRFFAFAIFSIIATV